MQILRSLLAPQNDNFQGFFNILLSYDGTTEFVFAGSRLHFHRGDTHVIADEWRGTPFPAAEPRNPTRRGPDFIARKDLDGRAIVAAWDQTGDSENR